MVGQPLATEVRALGMAKGDRFNETNELKSMGIKEVLSSLDKKWTEAIIEKYWKFKAY